LHNFGDDIAAAACDDDAAALLPLPNTKTE
jgi:hypothetical protein